jgi:hypothetical protein
MDSAATAGAKFERRAVNAYGTEQKDRQLSLVLVMEFPIKRRTFTKSRDMDRGKMVDLPCR